MACRLDFTTQHTLAQLWIQVAICQSGPGVGYKVQTLENFTLWQFYQCLLTAHMALQNKLTYQRSGLCLDLCLQSWQQTVCRQTALSWLQALDCVANYPSLFHNRRRTLFGFVDVNHKFVCITFFFLYRSVFFRWTESTPGQTLNTTE